MQELKPIRQHVFGRLIYLQSARMRAVRWIVIAVGVVLSLWAAFNAIAPFFQTRFFYTAKDFMQEYVLAKAVAAGDAPYQSVNLLAQRYAGTSSNLSLPSPHPPPNGILFFPFSYLDYTTAVYAWLAVQIASLLLSIFFLFTHLAGVP